MPASNPSAEPRRDHLFKPGYDPRRMHQDHSKRKQRLAIEELCREHADIAVAYIAGLIADTDAEHETRLKAANSLLDRAYGKAVDRVAIKQVGGDANSDARLLTTDQIIALLTPAALESTPQESCQQTFIDGCEEAKREGNEVFIPAHSDAIESGYIVVGDTASDGSGDPQHGDQAVMAGSDQPGAWPWDIEEVGDSNQAGDDRRSETTPLGDLK